MRGMPRDLKVNEPYSGNGFMIGQTFARLTVVKEAPRLHRKRRWHCVCSCGGSTIAYQWSLKSGRSRSCGCLKAEELNARQGHENHGMHDSAEYQLWLNLKKRCHDPRSSAYRYYGARGVVVCEPWRSSFSSFYQDVGPRPSGNHVLKLVRSNEGYSPGNCRWVRQRRGSNLGLGAGIDDEDAFHG